MSELNEAVKELRREILVRGVIYPRLVAQGKLTQTESDKRMLAMQTGLATLVRLLDSNVNQRLTSTGK